MTEDKVVELVVKRFRTFGGGSVIPDNPLSYALKNNAPQFAAGVDVRDVVRTILTAAQPEEGR